IEWQARGPFSLETQLSGLEKGEAVATLMEQLAEHRITVLGTDYLHWKVSKRVQDVGDDDGDEEFLVQFHEYTSTRILPLCIEPSGVQSRRVRLPARTEPPQFVPDTDPPTAVFVDGVQLVTEANSEATKDRDTDRGSKS